MATILPTRPINIESGQPVLKKDGTFTNFWYDTVQKLIALINLARDVTGRLPFANMPTIPASTLLGRGSTLGAGDIQTVTLGTGLAMAGTVLSATSGAGVPFFIAAGDTFTVPAFIQALFATPIDVEGSLVVDGMLIWVD